MNEEYIYSYLQEYMVDNGIFTEDQWSKIWDDMGNKWMVRD